MSINIEWLTIQYPNGLLVEPKSDMRKLYHLQCRGCGFESPDPLDTWNCCPRCGGSAWERYPVPGGQRPARDSEEPDGLHLVQFRVHSQASQMYIFGNFFGKRRLIAMHPENDDNWFFSLRLAAGTYRYRFYADDGERLVWFAPHHPNEKQRSCIDETLVVAGRDGPAPPAIPHINRLADEADSHAKGGSK